MIFKEISFRAKDWLTDEWRYGDLANVTMKNTLEPTEKTYIVKHAATGGMLYISERHRVKEDTVEQLAGIDKHGNRIYEKV